MLTLSHLHQLFSVETCQTYIHALRWKDGPLQCPRCQSHDVDPWGMYHYRPGCKRYWCNGCRCTFNDLTETLLHQSKRSLVYWILATFLLCLSCSSRVLRESWGSMAVRAIAGAGGCAIRRSPTKPIVSWWAPWKRMISITPPGRKAKPNTVAQSPWGADHVAVARNASPVGAMTTKTGQRSSPGSVDRGLWSSRRPKISR